MSECETPNIVEQSKLADDSTSCCITSQVQVDTKHKGNLVLLSLVRDLNKW